MKVYLAGQNNFGNRGCEALIRSSAWMVRQRFPGASFLCPSYQADLDRAQWPEAELSGVHFTDAPELPAAVKWWGRACRVLPWLEENTRPRVSVALPQQRDFAECDVLIMTGGDVISLDYGVPSLYEWAGFVDDAKRRGLTTILWAASVGPFSNKPGVERFMRQHLRSYDAITVRETESLSYLRGLGIENVSLVADPAFNLQPQACNIESLIQPGNTLGFNVSPLIRLFRAGDASRLEMDEEIVCFIRGVVKETGLKVLLIPHVGPLDGSSINSDWHYMKSLMGGFQDLEGMVDLAPATLNAAQLKHLLSKLRFFIGARTHATIGAISMMVPTLSIAYSVKAKGINRDLFGDTRYVLETPQVNRNTLRAGLQLLQNDEVAIKALLQSRLPEWRERAFGSVDRLQEVLA